LEAINVARAPKVLHTGGTDKDDYGKWWEDMNSFFLERRLT
jgi:hypothetical protein